MSTRRLFVDIQHAAAAVMVAVTLSASFAFAGPPSLVGPWQCTGPEGASSLVFGDAGTLAYNGEQQAYAVMGGVIYIAGQYGPVPYPYTLSDGVLAIAFPEGYSISCKPGTQPRAENKAEPAARAAALSGNFCSWSGSSTNTSSYSSTRWVRFDPAGRFSYGSFSAFSSTSGSMFRQGDGAEGGGTYRIEGDSVILTYDAGGSDTARVNMRQSDGSITELMHGKTLYATGLCQ